MALPELSTEQRQKNLELAAKMRRSRAALRADLKSGKQTLTEVLERADDPVVMRMKVSTLIESLPGYGKARAGKLMAKVDISATRRVQGLGARQRAALIEALSR